MKGMGNASASKKHWNVNEALGVCVLIEEKTLQKSGRVGGPCNGVPDNMRIAVDLVVVAAGRGLVPEEMHLLVMRQEAKTETLVPPGRIHVERDLPS